MRHRSARNDVGIRRRRGLHGAGFRPGGGAAAKFSGRGADRLRVLSGGGRVTMTALSAGITSVDQCGWRLGVGHEMAHSRGCFSLGLVVVVAGWFWEESALVVG